MPKICNSVQLHLDIKWKGQDKISLYRSTKILTFTIVFECFLGIDVEAEMLGTFERVFGKGFCRACSDSWFKVLESKESEGGDRQNAG